METKIKTHKIIAWASYLVLALIIALGIYLWYIGAFTHIEVIRRIVGVDTHPILAPIIFFVLQIIQIVIPIIPGSLTLSAGVILFGPWMGFVYNYTSIVLGSILAFMLGRYFGHKLLKHLVSPEKQMKYLKWLDDEKRFTKIFFLAILLPGAPDDILSMMAGLSKMTPRTFIIIMLVGKPLSIAAYSGLFRFVENFWH